MKTCFKTWKKFGNGTCCEVHSSISCLGDFDFACGVVVWERHGVGVRGGMSAFVHRAPPTRGHSMSVHRAPHLIFSWPTGRATRSQRKRMLSSKRYVEHIQGATYKHKHKGTLEDWLLFC